MKYVIISAVKDEERYINNTLLSVINQTIIPTLWIIVDDCSKDRTGEIIYNYVKIHKWIKVLRTNKDTGRQPGTGVIKAFNLGYEQVKDINYNFIVKLDCDLKFEPDYFKRLFEKFSANPKLGITSGVYKQFNGENWHVVSMPKYHAAGASKILRKECFEDIGGLVPVRGWDTLDEIRAQMLDWETQHFSDIIFYHLKSEGSGIGFLNTNAMQGEIFYKTGGSPVFFALKCLYRIFFGKPFLIGGFSQLLGYFRAWLKKEKIVNKEEERFYRMILNRRLLKPILRFLNIFINRREILK